MPCVLSGRSVRSRASSPRSLPAGGSTTSGWCPPARTASRPLVVTSSTPRRRSATRLPGHRPVPAFRVAADTACRSRRRSFVIRVKGPTARGAPRWRGTCCPRTASKARPARRWPTTNAANRWTVHPHGHQTLLTSESEVRLKGWGDQPSLLATAVTSDRPRRQADPHGLQVPRRVRRASARHALTAPGRPSRLLSGALRERCFPTGRSDRIPGAALFDFATSRPAAAAPLRLGADVVQRARDRPLPGRRHDRSPPGAERPEVGAQLTAILERRLTPART